MAKKWKKRTWKNEYDKVCELGEGGNAKVYKVIRKSNGEEFALKELNAGGSEKLGRFADEISIMNGNYKQIKGIIPIDNFSYDECWYTMPLAEPVIQHIKEEKLSTIEIVNGVIELCETLQYLHEKGISHRDIKPANIYYYQARFYFGDFGLVDFPESKNDFTQSDRGLGAIFTIAPEMKRDPKHADGRKADVFSLAKTMWMFLTMDEKGFDGVYNYSDANHSLRLRYLDKYKNEHTVEIEELLEDATDNNPENRPTIKEFKERLVAWVEIYKDINKSQVSDWKFLSKQIFGVFVPESASWKNISEIVSILNLVGRSPAYNHMLFHDGGGLDFLRAEVAAEENCIKVYDTFGLCFILKPKRLYFEDFGTDVRWNYFLIELDELNPILKNNSSSSYEFLVEDMPAHYVSAQYVQYGVYDYESGNPLPNGFQRVQRYTKGKFLIVMKDGPYNKISGTYDGRHGNITAVQFREYVEQLIELYNAIKDNERFEGIPGNQLEDKILSLEVFNKNPFDYRNFQSKSQESYQEQKNQEIMDNVCQYVRQEYMNWNFSDILQNYTVESTDPIRFAFKLVEKMIHFSAKRLSQNYISINGYIQQSNKYSNENFYYLSDRDSAIELRDKLNERIKEILKTNIVGFEADNYCFSIEIELSKSGNPEHLFVKKEIEEAMRNADDRVNNQLVIDENGYVKIIQDYGMGPLFPVRHEMWVAGNAYVGKYSTLSTLDDDYIASLQGWLLYLKTGRRQYMDYVHDNDDEDKLLQEICKYYPKNKK